MFDFKKRLLINIRKNLIKPVGGPRGYVYNLKLFFDEHKVKNVHYVDENIDEAKLVTAYKKQGGILKDRILNR